jgi:hypothetical protein
MVWYTATTDSTTATSRVESSTSAQPENGGGWPGGETCSSQTTIRGAINTAISSGSRMTQLSSRLRAMMAASVQVSAETAPRRGSTVARPCARWVQTVSQLPM